MTVGPELPAGSVLPANAPDAALYAPQLPTATAAQVAAKVAGTPTPAKGAPPGIPIVGRQFGTVVSVQIGTLTITLGGSSVPIPGAKYMSTYTPKAGDVVVIDHIGTDLLVVGTLAGGTGGGGGGGVPIGAMLPFPVNSTPAGYLLCDGSTFSAATYPSLTTVLGGTTLPDMRDRLPMGAGTNVSVGSTAGATMHSITTNEMPSHSHSHNHGSHSHSHSHSASDSGHSHPGIFNILHDTSGGFNANVTTGGGGYNASALPSDHANISVGTDGTGATPSTDSTTTGSGNSMSILNPVRGVAWYIRAL